VTDAPAPADPIAGLLRAFKASALVDLTHRLEPGIPAWPTHPHYCQTVVESYATGGVSLHHALSLGEHTGTHFDAPVHFIGDRPQGWAIDAAPLETFFGRMATIDATALGPRGLVEPGHIAAWEREHGRIVPGDAVFFRFGWDRHWRDPARRALFLADWPGLSAAASALLVGRGARIVGCDCLSIDRFGSEDFPAHRTLLGAGVLIGENFANLDRVPPVCAIAALPLPVAGGSGAPARAVAFVGPRGRAP